MRHLCLVKHKHLLKLQVLRTSSMYTKNNNTGYDEIKEEEVVW